MNCRRLREGGCAVPPSHRVRKHPPHEGRPFSPPSQADAEAAALAKRQAEHEAARVAADELRRKNEKIKKLEEEMHIDAVSAALVEAGQDPKSKTHQELLELTVEQVEAEAQRKLVKSMQAAEKRREKRRLEQGFLVRAMREREQDELDAWVAAHMSVDSAYAEKQQELMRLRAEKLHEQTQVVKRRLARMMPFLGGFEDSIFQQRKEAHAAELVRACPRLAPRRATPPIIEIPPLLTMRRRDIADGTATQNCQNACGGPIVGGGSPCQPPPQPVPTSPALRCTLHRWSADARRAQTPSPARWSVPGS